MTSISLNLLCVKKNIIECSIPTCMYHNNSQGICKCILSGPLGKIPVKLVLVCTLILSCYSYIAIIAICQNRVVSCLEYISSGLILKNEFPIAAKRGAVFVAVEPTHCVVRNTNVNLDYFFCLVSEPKKQVVCDREWIHSCVSTWMHDSDLEI